MPNHTIAAPYSALYRQRCGYQTTTGTGYRVQYTWRYVQWRVLY
jgi:hypothetical protein